MPKPKPAHPRRTANLWAIPKLPVPMVAALNVRGIPLYYTAEKTVKRFAPTWDIHTLVPELMKYPLEKPAPTNTTQLAPAPRAMSGTMENA